MLSKLFQKTVGLFRSSDVCATHIPKIPLVFGVAVGVGVGVGDGVGVGEGDEDGEDEGDGEGVGVGEGDGDGYSIEPEDDTSWDTWTEPKVP